MSQLNFFMTQNEINETINQLLKSENYIIFNNNIFDKEKPLESNNINDFIDSKKIIIWIKNEFEKPICRVKNENNNTFMFDYYFQPIIELEITPNNNNQLIFPHRIFYKSGWIKNDHLRQIHIKECNKLVRFFKNKIGKPLLKINFFYLSKEIINLLKCNSIEIELGQGGKIINNINNII